MRSAKGVENEQKINFSSSPINTAITHLTAEGGLAAKRSFFSNLAILGQN